MKDAAEKLNTFPSNVTRCFLRLERRLRRFSVQILQALFSFHSLWNFERRSGVNAALL